MNAPAVRARSEQRHEYLQDVRQRMLEDDMDEKDRQLYELRQELRGVKQILIGILISTATASIIGAINLLLSK